MKVRWGTTVYLHSLRVNPLQNINYKNKEFYFVESLADTTLMKWFKLISLVWGQKLNHTQPDRMCWEHNIIPVIFLPKMYISLKLIMSQVSNQIERNSTE